MTAEVEKIIEEIIEYNNRWKYILNRTPRRYHVGCATVVHHDLYDISVDVPNEEWAEWLYGAVQYWSGGVRIGRHNGRLILRSYISAPQGIAATIRLASCSCGQCEYVKRHSGAPPPLSSLPYSDEPILHNRGWRVVWCGGSYAIRLDPGAIIEDLAEALIAAAANGLTPLVYAGDRYYLVLRRDELTIRITAPVPPHTAGRIYASAADVMWSWRLAPSVVLYDDCCMEVTTWPVVYILGAPNIRGISQLLYALS